MNGFNLIEVMIVLAIFSMVGAFSLPLYSNYLVHARRLEAESVLTQLAVAMEQFHIEQNTYENATLSTLNVLKHTIQNYYRFNIHIFNPNHYVLSAIPLGFQAKKDKLCGTLTLNALQQKGITGRGNIHDCW